MIPENELGLGRTMKGWSERRDAFHVAVIKVRSAERLRPGQHVGAVDGGYVSSKAAPVGIVDPFLTEEVEPYQPFWLVIYPGTVTSLKHDWSHPAFAKDDAEAWLQNAARRACMDFDDMIEAAVSGEGGHGGDDYARELPDDPEFWVHLEALTGKKFDEAHREKTWFSCAC